MSADQPQDRDDLCADQAIVRSTRVQDRRTFATLASSRRRARSGPVAVHYEPAPPGEHARRFAYSVPRQIGSAVERNRHRRRLRTVARELAPHVPPGAYLIGLRPTTRAISFEELRKRVIESTRAASAGRDR